MNQHKIGIGILPPKEYCNFVRKKEIYLAKKYNTVQGLLQPPHVTIKWPFEVGDLEPIEKYCEQLAKRMKPFTITIDGYGYFPPKVIFLSVVSSKELNDVHLQIIDDLKNQFEIEKAQFEGIMPQKFHTTLAYDDLTPDQFLISKEELDGEQKPVCLFTFNAIGLFRFTGQEWVVENRYEVQ